MLWVPVGLTQNTKGESLNYSMYIEPSAQIKHFYSRKGAILIILIHKVRQFNLSTPQSVPV